MTDMEVVAHCCRKDTDFCESELDKSVKMNGHMNRQMEGQMKEQMNGQMEGQMNGQMNGQTAELMESESDGCGNVGCEETGRCNMDDIGTPGTLKDLITGLHKIFAHDKVNVDFVKSYMGLYKSNEREWKKFAKFDQFRYTRNLVDTGNEKFNLMVLCWNEAQGSSIHSHANAHCFMKVLSGSVQEELFDWPTESDVDGTAMTSKCVNKYDRNGVAYINDDLGLHRVENPSHSDKAVSLHLYSPPFDSCDTFDEKTGHKNSCKVTFWSKFGHRTPFGKTGQDIMEVPENN